MFMYLGIRAAAVNFEMQSVVMSEQRHKNRPTLKEDCPSMESNRWLNQKEWSPSSNPSSADRLAFVTLKYVWRMNFNNLQKGLTIAGPTIYCMYLQDNSKKDNIRITFQTFWS